MRGVMFHQHQTAGGEAGAQGQMQFTLVSGAEGADQRDAIHRFAIHAGQAQGRFNGIVREFAGFIAARDFLLFHGRRQRAVLQHRAGRFVEQTTESENDHFDFFSILAQVSRSATVRLNTGFSAVLSGSTEK